MPGRKKVKKNHAGANPHSPVTNGHKIFSGAKLFPKANTWLFGFMAIRLLTFPISLLPIYAHYPMIIGKRKKTGRLKNAIQKIRKNGLGS
jgi:hypothetical protein